MEVERTRALRVLNSLDVNTPQITERTYSAGEAQHVLDGSSFADLVNRRPFDVSCNTSNSADDWNEEHILRFQAFVGGGAAVEEHLVKVDNLDQLISAAQLHVAEAADLVD